MVALADQGSLGTTTPPGQSGNMVTSNSTNKKHAAAAQPGCTGS